MKSSSFQQAIQAQFDCLTKKVIKRAAMKYNRDISRRLKHEVPFSEISDLELNKAGVYDKYSSDYTAFNVLGMEVQVSDDQLSKALKCLPERKRNIILLSYFMDMSDAEIGELMNVVRTTVYRHRTSTSGRITKNDGGGISMDKDQKHIPFAVIVAATNGDETAIQEILDFYDGYISKLSLRKLYDEYGNVYMVVDSELKGRIQAAVMDMIANFEIVVI